MHQAADSWGQRKWRPWLVLCLLVVPCYLAWQVFSQASNAGGPGWVARGPSSQGDVSAQGILVDPGVGQQSGDVTGAAMSTNSGDTTGLPASGTTPASSFVSGSSGSPAPSPESAPMSAQPGVIPTSAQPGVTPTLAQPSLGLPSTPASPTPGLTDPATPSAGAPALPVGVTGKYVGEETGAQLFADASWQKSSSGQIQPASNCAMRGTSAMDADGSYVDMYVPASPAWECVAIESDAAAAPGHIYQIEEYIPALANGNIADYPSWWMTDAGWNSEVDMAEAHAWGGTATLDGSMCLDIHLDQGSQNTTPHCLTEAAGWHTYTMVWAATGAITMYYDGAEVHPTGVSGTTATDMHMIIWNNNNGGSGSVASTLKLAYLAEWSL